MIASIFEIDLPITDPVIKFFIILLIILFIPILSDKVKIPHLLGMIVAGILIGPYGFNLLPRDSSIILSGTAGMLYIMFLAGLEIDINDFKKNVGKSTVLGFYGFTIPMVSGILASVYILGFSWMTAVLLASMFASNTLITYPIVSKLGIAKNQAVNISVGSSLITNILALLVLAVIVGLSTSEITNAFWIQLTVSFIVFTLILLFVFPLIARWFLKRFDDSVSQFIFILVMVFLGAVLSKLAGIEPIIGAFMAGLGLNRLIPRTSPLMNRIDFVGNAIFIPFFLIGVGMLIDYRAFSSLETIFVAVVMTVVATGAKFMAAWLTQKNFKYSKDERLLIFGLTNAQAASTLAAVLIGYKIGLLNDSVLNGTIIMILVTCTIASFATQKGANVVAKTELKEEDENEVSQERILIPISNPANIQHLIDLSVIIKSKNNRDGLYAINIIRSDDKEPATEKNGRKALHQAKVAASAVDLELNTLLRYDASYSQGITNVIREQSITDLILGLHMKEGMSDTFLGNLTEGILENSNVTTFIYHPFQPIATIQRHIVVIPGDAEYESGFSFWLSKIWNIALNTGGKIVFYSTEKTNELLKTINQKHPIELELNIFSDWDDFLILSKDMEKNDNLAIVMSRPDSASYNKSMDKIPSYLQKYFYEQNFLLIYPQQKAVEKNEQVDLTNPSLLQTIEKVDTIGKTIAGIFRKK